MHTRHTQLLDFVNSENRISVAVLSQKLQVSEVTIRKDLDILEKKGLLRREHGFAVMIASDDIAHHLSFNYDTKRRIAQKAAVSVKNGETVMIESGSCCALLAEELATKRRDITIITNSAFIAAFIRKAPSARIVLLGGDYQNESQVMVGPMLKKCVQDFFVDKVFIGTDGFTEKHGFTGNNLLRTEAIRTMAENANKIIILTESIKFSQQGVVAQFRPEEIAAIFTDDHISEEKKQFLQNLNTKIYTVPCE